MHSGITAESRAESHAVGADEATLTVASAQDEQAATHHHADANPEAQPVDESTPEHSEHSCCTCLGQCCTMSPATVSFANHEVVVDSVAERAVLPFADTAHSPQRAEHLLPFANGPPTRA